VTKQVAETSMTVHSKEAYKMIYGMFNVSLGATAEQPSEDAEFEKHFALASCEYFLKGAFYIAVCRSKRE
jgi:hypothetical protein